MSNFVYTMRSFFHANRNYFANILHSVWHAVLAALKILWSLVGPIIVLPLFKIAHLLNDHFPELWQRLLRPEFIRQMLSRYVIRKYGNITQARPHPFSMHADYPSWTGYVDREFSGRHLAPADANAAKPSTRDLEQLFMRPVPTGGQVDDVRSNLLFATFAQWFTDSFLRTSHKLKYDPKGNTIDGPDGTKERHDGRVRENESNHEIDLCQIYGMDARMTDILRFRPCDKGYDPALHKGTLKSQMINGEEFPATLLAHPPSVPSSPDDKDPRTDLTFHPDFTDLYEDEKLVRSIFSSAIGNANGYESLFACGLEHGNSTIGNSLFNTIFLRHHNYVARKIATAERGFSDDEVFEKARNVMIVLLLKIVVCDYVRHISPLNLPFVVPKKAGKGQSWYRRNRIQIEFNLLYRWHSLVPDIFPFLADTNDQRKNFGRFRHNNGWLTSNGVAHALTAFMETPAGKMTLGNTPQVLRMVKRDTLKLMRAANLQSYNDYRDRFGLHKVESFEEVTGEKVIAAALSDLYDGKIQNLEFYIGMVAERHQQGGMMGDLMLHMVAHDALTHALTNPLLSDEAQAKLPGYTKPGEHVFSRTGVKIIDSIETLDQLVQNVVDDLPAGRTVSFRKPGS